MVFEDRSTDRDYIGWPKRLIGQNQLSQIDMTFYLSWHKHSLQHG